MRDEHPRRIAGVEAAKQAALEMGGADAVARQHQRGKLSCRERLDLLLDPASFIESGILAQALSRFPGGPQSCDVRRRRGRHRHYRGAARLRPR